MTDEFGIWKEAVLVYASYYPIFYLEVMKENPKPLSEDSRFSGRVSNSEPPKYKSRPLPLD
jgi:hypothetical protein